MLIQHPVPGDQRKFLSCLLTFKVVMDQENVQPSNELDDNALSWMEEIGSTAKTVEEALHDEKVFTPSRASLFTTERFLRSLHLTR